MYTKRFGLNMLPFENVHDPMFFFNEGDHARARNRITESFNMGRGVTILTGPAGSGKTTLSQMIISDFSDDIRLIWMVEPPGNSKNLFLYIAQELGLKPLSTEKTIILRDIRDALLTIYSEGNKCLLIIDETQLMTDDTINGIRSLNNLAEGPVKLVQILLLGQEGLLKTINRPEMKLFKKCVATLETIGKMDADRMRKYISHRIQVAGGQPSVFTDTGLEAVVKAFGSGSTPRVINSLCERSLNTAFEREKKAVDVDDVYLAADGMGIQDNIYNYKLELEQRGNSFSINKTVQKSLNDYYRSFINKVLNIRDRKPAETMNSLTSLQKMGEETVKELDIPDSTDKKPMKEEKTDFSSEWVTVNSKGTKPFKPANVNGRILTRKNEIAARRFEWVTKYAKMSDEFEIDNAEDKRSRNKGESAPYSEWMTMDSKGLKPFNTTYVKGKKTGERQKIKYYL